MIAHVIDKPRTWVIAHPELVLSTEQHKHLHESLARLERGEPLPYIVGHWEFFGMQFEVTPDVLIPRPETELLVEKAIAWLQAAPANRLLADVGTGSGAIAISIAVHVPEVKISATDISPKALQVAKRNAVKLGVNERIEFIECDLLPHPFAPIPTPHGGASQGEGLRERGFNLICGNLPYIPTTKLHGLTIYGREPTLALNGGEDGLDQFRKLMKIAPEWLARDGLMLLEIEATQGLKALSLAQDAFAKAYISLHKDLAGKDRLLKIGLQPADI